MASVSLLSGGNFYAPFSTSKCGTQFIGPDPVAGVWGAWVDIIPAVSSSGRWMEIELQDILALPGRIEYELQVGRRINGVETLWFPTANGLWFIYDPALEMFQQVFKFPISTQPGDDIIGRMRSDTPGIHGLLMHTNLWV